MASSGPDEPRAVLDICDLIWLYLVMRSVTVGKFKAKLSAYLKAVRSGEEILVKSRDIPVARVVPVSIPDEDARKWINPISKLDLSPAPYKLSRNIDSDKILRDIRRDKR